MEQPKGFVSRWIGLSLHHPKKVLGGALLLTLLSAFLATGLSIRGDFAALLPEDYPSVKGFEVITQKVGGLGFMMVVVEGQTPKQVAFMTKNLAQNYKKLTSVVRNVQYHKVSPFVKKRLLYYANPSDLQEFYKRLVQLKAYIKAENKRQNPMVIDLDDSSEKKKPLKPPTFDDLLQKYGLKQGKYHSSNLISTEDEKLAVILLQPNGLESDLKFIKRMVKQIQATTQKTIHNQPKALQKGLKIHYTGRYMVRYEDDRALQKQLRSITIFSLLGVLFLLLFSTRRKRSLVLIGTPLIVGVIWTGGVASQLAPRGEINIIAAFIVAVLFGLGIDFGIHLFTRYQTERLSGKELGEALELALHSTGAAGLIAVLTSAAAFFIIQLTELKGISQFGQIAGVGLLMILLSMIWLFPALAVWFEQLSPLVPTKREQGGAVNTVRLPFQTRPLYWKTSLFVGLFVLVGGATVILTGSIQFENNLWRLITQGKAVKIYDRLKRDVFKGELEPGILLFTDQKALKSFQEQATKELHEKKWPAIRSMLSIYTLVPDKKKQKRVEAELIKMRQLLAHRIFRSVSDEEDKEKIEKLKRLVAAKPFGIKDVPKELRRFLGANNPLLFVVPNINPTQIDQARIYSNQLVAMSKKLGKGKGKIWIGDSNLILSDMIFLVKRDGPRAVGLVFLAVLFILFIAFRRQKYAIWLVLSPLAVGFSAMFILMWFFEIKLNPFNVVMLPVTLGIGIDHGVYIYYHWNEDGRGKISPKMGAVFYAILLASVTSLIGFGSLALATHKGIHSIGLLAVMGILCSTIAAFTVLPSLFTWLHHKANQPK